MHANPLFFTMLVGLWLGSDGQAQDLPQTEVELYQAGIGRFAAGAMDSPTDPDPSVVERLGADPAQMRAVLKALACTVQGQERAGSGHNRLQRRTVGGAAL